MQQRRKACRPLAGGGHLALMVLPIPLDAGHLLHHQHCCGTDGDDGGSLHAQTLDFAAFPSVLLLTTLMRLSLNVASTRVVLLEGHTGPGAAGAP